MQWKERFSILAAGLALFSMFFGAGDLIWPLILGGTWGDKNFFAMLGLLVTGVTLPLIGLLSMMLFQGDYHAFFGRLGKMPSVVLIFIIQMILGPIGSIPRLFSLSYATLKPYLSADLSLLTFSIIACVVVFAFSLRKQNVVSLLGLILTPILLLSLGAILVIGFSNPPVAPIVESSNGDAFRGGLMVGYNTLDLIASFIFAPLVMSHFITEDKKQDVKTVFGKMLKASFIAAGLLATMYVGLTYVSSFYAHVLPPHAREERLSAIALHLLGPYGGFLSSIAVAMACLTTAIPLTAICADYFKQDIFQGKGGTVFPLILTLGISCAIANLGFMGIANMLGPVLQILCPGLIVLSLLNIFNKLYEFRYARVPVYATFAVTTVSHLV